jgi:sugar/nucleoside kinase (ribokinase family)
MSDVLSKRVGVLCAGSVVQDTIVGPCEALRWGTTTFVDSMDRHLGGNGANTARALAMLGNNVRLLGTVGSDDAAAFATAELSVSDVDIHLLLRVDRPNAATTVLVNAAGDRQFLHLLGSSHEAFKEPLEFSSDVTAGMHHFHLASFFVLPHLRTNAAEMLRRAKQAGLTTSLDVNWDPLGEWMGALEPCLRHVDILFLNEDESRMLTGSCDPAVAADHLQSCGAGVVVQKFGREGCAIYPADRSSEIRCAPFDVAAVDSTGAGDCFAAGFLSAHLRALDFAQAGEWGNAAGALSVGSIGAVAGLLSAAEFEMWRRTAPRRPADGRG